MNVILYLLGGSLLLGGGGLLLFLWSLRSGQYRGPGRRRQPHPVRRRLTKARGLGGTDADHAVRAQARWSDCGRQIGGRVSPSGVYGRA